MTQIPAPVPLVMPFLFSKFPLRTVIQALFKHVVSSLVKFSATVIMALVKFSDPPGSTLKFPLPMAISHLPPNTCISPLSSTLMSLVVTEPPKIKIAAPASMINVLVVVMSMSWKIMTVSPLLRVEPGATPPTHVEPVSQTPEVSETNTSALLVLNSSRAMNKGRILEQKLLARLGHSLINAADWQHSGFSFFILVISNLDSHYASQI